MSDIFPASEAAGEMYYYIAVMTAHKAVSQAGDSHLRCPYTLNGAYGHGLTLLDNPYKSLYV